MAGAKETPRQKMIGMMYLVLTALLALNVSADILNAFYMVNDGLTATNKNMLDKNAKNYTIFENQYKIAPEKVKEAWGKAQEAQKLTKDMIAYIKNLMYELVIAVDKLQGPEAEKVKSPEWTLKEVKGKDNYDIPTHFMLGADHVNGQGGKAVELKKEIEKYKENMKNLLPEKYREKVAAGFGIDTKGPFKNLEGKEETWEMHNFYHMVILAVYCNLNQMISEVQNIEYDVVSTLYSSISADDFKFDKIEAKVVAKSNYVVSGDSYEAEIFVAAYDSKQNPEILIGSGVDTTKQPPVIIGQATPVPVSNGVGKYKVGAGGSGDRQYGGLINVKNPSTGEVKSYPFRSSYTVAPPSSTISADKMNVFYAGIANPISVSVAGAAADKVQAQAIGATLTKTGAGKWNVMVSPGAKEVIIKASAMVGGTNRGAGEAKFRVRPLPNPTPVVIGATNNTASKTVLATTGEVKAVLQDFLFEGISYSVKSFSVAGGNPYFDEKCYGSKFSEAAKNGIRNSKPSTISVYNVVVTGQDGTTRNLPGSVTVKLTN